MNRPYLNTLLTLVPLILAGCGSYTHTVRQVPHARQERELLLNDSTISLAAGKHYQTGKLHTFLFGKHYRDAWSTPVPVKVLDLEREKGGLSPLKQGGAGRRSTSGWRTVSAGSTCCARLTRSRP